jgi:hypothetical protein
LDVINIRCWFPLGYKLLIGFNGCMAHGEFVVDFECIGDGWIFGSIDDDELVHWTRIESYDLNYLDGL